MSTVLFQPPHVRMLKAPSLVWRVCWWCVVWHGSLSGASASVAVFSLTGSHPYRTNPAQRAGCQTGWAWGRLARSSINSSVKGWWCVCGADVEEERSRHQFLHQPTHRESEWVRAYSWYSALSFL
jgi:hypothetical protein